MKCKKCNRRFKQAWQLAQNFPISSQSSDATGAATVSAANGMGTPSTNSSPPPVEGVQSTI